MSVEEHDVNAMHDPRLTIPTRHGHDTSDDGASPLQRQRFDAAFTCMNVPISDLPWTLLAELAPMFHHPTLADLPAPAGDLALMDQILAGIARGTDQDASALVRCVAAGMLYFRPYELPPAPAPSHLPLWIRIPYLRWTLSVPPGFADPAEAERYQRWLAPWLRTIELEFAEGRGISDFPEYQWRRLRGLIEQQLAGAAYATFCTR